MYVCMYVCMCILRMCRLCMCLCSHDGWSKDVELVHWRSPRRDHSSDHVVTQHIPAPAEGQRVCIYINDMKGTIFREELCIIFSQVNHFTLHTDPRAEVPAFTISCRTYGGPATTLTCGAYSSIQSPCQT